MGLVDVGGGGVSKPAKFTLDAVVVIFEASDGWDWLPKTVIFVRNYINLCQLTNLCLLWRDINNRWVSIEPIFLWPLSIWIVDILLESNTEWQRDHLISTFWKSDLLRG